MLPKYIGEQACFGFLEKAFPLVSWEPAVSLLCCLFSGISPDLGSAFARYRVA
jgi:hypothetical protein